MGKKIKIMLDPGHDSATSNQSPVWRSYYEGNQMWRLTQFQKTALEARGFIVGITKQSVNHEIGVTTRGRMAKGYDALISNHSNACGTESVDRPEAIYLVDDNCGEIDEVSKDLALILAQTVENVMGTDDSAKIYSRLSGNDRDGDGKRNDDYFGVLYGAHQVGVPALILEHSFHTNLRAAKWMMKDENLRRLAEAEADALAAYYDMDGIGFVDVDPDAWYAEPVERAGKNGITSGVDATHFSPDDPCTRAEAVTLLWRAMGSPEPEGKILPFSDVPTGAWYAKAAQWAVEKGITSGTDIGKFSPAVGCTRGQIVTFLYRLSGSTPAKKNLSFSDVAKGAYYHDAVMWAAENKITSGVNADRFAPDRLCTRAETVTFLYRFMGIS